MTTLVVKSVFVVRGRGTAIEVEIEGDGTIRPGEVARVRLASGEERALKIRGVEMLDRWTGGRLVGSMAIRVDGVGADELAVGERIEVTPAV